MKEAGGGTPDPAKSPAPGNLSPGMAALMRPEANGTKSGGASQTNQNSAERPFGSRGSIRRKWVLGSLFVADALLLALAAMLIVQRHGHAGFMEISLGVMAVVMGAWLSCLAIFRWKSD